VRDRNSISVHADFCVFLSMLLLIIPLKWGISWVLAATIHELFHYIALRICKVDIFAIHITARGASMETSPFTGSSELLCALAGPAGSLLLLVVGKYAPRVALCALMQAAYNLLPIYPLDGGRALQWALHRLFPQRGELIQRIINIGTIGALLVLSIYALLRLELGLLPFLMVTGILHKNKYVNCPCKPSVKRVQ